MTAENTTAAQGVPPLSPPLELQRNAENRRVVISPVPGEPSTARYVVERHIDSVENLGLEVFVQCLYLVPGVGNALSLKDVAIDLYRICSSRAAATSVVNWMILVIDALGVFPALGNASVPVRRGIKDVLLAMIKGEGIALALELLWGMAGGDAMAYLESLDKKLQQAKADIVTQLKGTSQHLRGLIAEPRGMAVQQATISAKKSFWSWMPDGETVTLYALDQLLKAHLPGSTHTIRESLTQWLLEFEGNAEQMIGRALGSAAEAASLLGMAAQIAAAAKARRGMKKPSHRAERAAGQLGEADVKPAQHREHYQTGATPSSLPAGCNCLLPQSSKTSGRPIDYAMGDENLSQTDFVVDGVVPIVWTRLYRSSLGAYDNSPLGARWSSPFHLSLAVTDATAPDELTFFDTENRAVPLPTVAVGQTVEVPAEKLQVARPDRYTVVLSYTRGSEETYTLVESAAGARYRLAATRDQAGLGHTLSYDEAGDLVGITDNHDAAIRLAYRDGRVSTIDRLNGLGHELGRLATYEYDTEGNLISQRDALDHIRTYAYEYHLLTRYTDFNGYAVHLEWTWPGQTFGAVAPTNPADARCSRTYISGPGADRAGSREILEDTRFEYHREHWFTKVTDAAGKVTFYRYDRDNRIVLVERPGDTGLASELYEWDANNNLTATRDAAGRWQRFAYDDAGRMVEHTDAVGRVTRTEYDANGNPVKVTDPTGRVTQTAYDDLGQPVSVTDPAGRTTQYLWNGQGQLIALTDPKGGVRKFSYLPGGRLSQATDCSGYTTAYGYDAFGHLLARTDAEGHVTTYQHDALGRLTSITYPDKTTEGFAYDGEGNLISHTDGAGQVTRHHYTIDGHPVGREDAAGRTLRFDYDSQWRLMRLVNENRAETRFRYDALGQLVEQTGFDGTTVRHTYDERGVRVLTHEIPAGKAPASDPKAEVQNGGIETAYEYDALGRLTERQIRRFGKTHADCHEHFYYDALGRLVMARSGEASTKFHYDEADNLIAEEQRISLESFVGSASESPYSSVTRHWYDALGNRTRTQLPNTVKIDWLRYGSGHVHGVTLNGASLFDFERDRLHRETRRTHASLRAERQYDPAGRLLRQIAQRAATGDVGGAPGEQQAHQAHQVPPLAQ